MNDYKKFYKIGYNLSNKGFDALYRYGKFRESEPVTAHFYTSNKIEDVRHKIISVFQNDGGTIKSEGEGVIVASFGSNIKFRLMGALMGGIENAPREVFVGLKRNSNSSEILIVVRDTLGFGSRLGFEKALEKLMFQNAASIIDVFSDAMDEEPDLRQNTANSHTVADELMKLKQLLDLEAITQEEYDQQKRKLLS